MGINLIKALCQADAHVRARGSLAMPAIPNLTKKSVAELERFRTETWEEPQSQLSVWPVTCMEM